MWTVAGYAPIHFAYLVLEYERTALIHVALQAGLLVVVRLVQHLRCLPHAERWREAAMRIVAIAALHEALVHSVLEWQIELRPHVRVALVTCLGLAFRKQILWCFGIVNGVATRAGDIAFRVL